MADEKQKKVAEPSKSNAKAEKPAKKADAKAKDASKKKENVFKRMGKKIAKFFKDEKGECKKIVWPDKKTVLKSTGVVLLTVAVLGLILFAVDQGLAAGVRGLVNLADRVGSEAETTTQVAGQIVSGLLGM